MKRTMIATLAAALALAATSQVQGANRAYHGAGIGGSPNTGNWSWTTRRDGQHVWWTKHHWIEGHEDNLALLSRRSKFELETFNGATKAGCDIFTVKAIVGAPAGFRLTAVSDCGSNGHADQVNAKVDDPSQVPLTRLDSNDGVSWAVVLIVKSDPEIGPLPCPLPVPGSTCPRVLNSTEVNMEYQKLPTQAWQGKITLERCPGGSAAHSGTLKYRAIASDPEGLAAANTCP